MEKHENHSTPPTNRDSSSTPTSSFDVKNVRAYIIRPSGPDDHDHNGWVVEIKFSMDDHPNHKLYGSTPKDVLDKLMQVFA